MHDNNQEVEELFSDLTALGVDWENFGSRDLRMIEDHVKPINSIVWINDGIRSLCHFINDAGKHYYNGIKENYLAEMGFTVYQAMMHPDHFDDFHKAIYHWDNYPNDIYNTTFRVKNKKGEWRWTYSSSKALNFTEAGKPEFVLSIVHDIEEIVHYANFEERETFFESEQHLFNNLTPRELEIIRLISMELTTKQIAEKLLIESSTVDTHRKNMIRKLGVKTSIGLARFYFLFGDRK